MPAYYRYHSGLDWRAAEIDLGAETSAYLHKNKDDGSWGFEIVSIGNPNESPWPQSHETSSYARACRKLEGLLVGRTESDHSVFGKIENGPTESKRSLMFCGLVSYHLPQFIEPIIGCLDHFEVLTIYVESTVPLDLHMAESVRDILYKQCTLELQEKSFGSQEFKPDYHAVGPTKRQKRDGSRTRSQDIGVQKSPSGISLFLAFLALSLLITVLIRLGFLLRSSGLI